jgi:Ca2+-binding RTX toxin-like protein
MAVIFGTNGFDVINGTDNADELYGNMGNDILFAFAGNDTISGGLGADTMFGGAGNDTYLVDNFSDQVIEESGEGTDGIIASVSYALGANIENLRLDEFAGAINGTGNELDNELYGNASANVLSGGDGDDSLYGGGGNDELRGGNGDDYLDGGTGADIMIGGSGVDFYVVDSVNDVVIEETDAFGYRGDRVMASINYTLGANVEDLWLQGNAAISGTGNELDNYIAGNDAVNVLSGGRGDDVLNGNGGGDTMIGGLGDDSYKVEEADDIVREEANEGHDQVTAWISYTLTAHVEDLTLGDSDSARNGTGNDLDNRLTGNEYANTLTGGAGHDVLDGSMGADTMIGGTGNDTYWVGQAGDAVTEQANQGTDTVVSSVDFTLGANVENLILQDAARIGTGNGLNNEIFSFTGAADTLYGLGGNDVLDGGNGADTMVGGTGNDRYFVENAGDVVSENANEGFDTVNSTRSYTLGANVENLVLMDGGGRINGIGNALDNQITGNAFDNFLEGGAGADILWAGRGNDVLEGMSGNDWLYGEEGSDTLVGGEGADMLISGKGSDTFEFRSTSDSAVGATDLIVDFQRGFDTIDLSMIDARRDVVGNHAFTFIGGGNFTGVSGQLHFRNGFVEGDVNGDAVADFAIEVQYLTSMSASDFVL